ncbi:60S acidic ribosomal protein P2 [Nosema granulosis]|uniref:60S acidic ribosomal protein P2 n=1 Tax=Nosema granulosis TaxID=83296 RepID=A0A9P6GZK4_9MICR|nr:60S acidic ribosomal protein P2 [Nosema granulosis]
MDIITAHILLDKTGMETTIDNYNMLFKAIDKECDTDVLELYISKTEGMSLQEIMAKGDEIINSLALQVAAAQPAAVEKVETKEEKVEEEPEEAVEVSLFGDDEFF